MATHDYVIDNQTSASARADINSVLQAIVTNNSSATAPTQTYGNMFWYDTANNFLKMRNEADSQWIIIGYIDQATGQFDVRTDVIQAVTAGGTAVKNSSGSTILDLKPTSQATAEAGTNNTEIMTPLRVKQSIDANATGGGWLYIASFEPVTDVQSINQFIGNGYRSVRVSFGAQTVMSGGQFIVQAGQTTGTMRNVIQASGNGTDSFFGSVLISNFNNHVSGIPKVSTGLIGMGDGDFIDRSDSIDYTEVDRSQASYASYNEAWEYVGIAVNTGYIEGSDADRRAWVYVEGLV
jgi:hypothetical protein